AADNVYTYRVEACGPGDLCSDHSNEATTVTPPVAPSGLSATAIGPDAAEVEWVDDVRTETSFELRRRPVGGSFTAVATLSAGATGFSDDGLESETSYEYQIRACNEEGCSSWGGSAGVTTWMLPPADLEA